MAAGEMRRKGDVAVALLAMPFGLRMQVAFSVEKPVEQSGHALWQCLGRLVVFPVQSCLLTCSPSLRGRFKNLDVSVCMTATDLALLCLWDREMLGVDRNCKIPGERRGIMRNWGGGKL